jgi:hypothetical protein
LSLGRLECRSDRRVAVGRQHGDGRPAPALDHKWTFRWTFLGHFRSKSVSFGHLLEVPAEQQKRPQT